MKAFDKITAILTELCGTDTVRPEDRLQADLGLDSLQMVTMLILLEDGFGIVFDESDMNPFDLATVGQVMALVGKYVGDDDEE